MIEETVPIRDRLIKLQADSKIIIDRFNYGLSRNAAYVNIEFEVTKTHEQVVRAFRGSNLQEAANKAMSFLEQVQ
jgi:hypothetical protein